MRDPRKRGGSACTFWPRPSWAVTERLSKHFLTPSLLCGNWEVEHALFDRISNTVSSRLVHFMIILVVFFLRWMETLRDHFVSTFRCRSSFYSLLLKLGCCYPVVHYQVLGMYFKELHTCLVNGALLRLLLVINFPMEMVTWIKIQDCACLQDWL